MNKSENFCCYPLYTKAGGQVIFCNKFENDQEHNQESNVDAHVFVDADELQNMVNQRDYHDKKLKIAGGHLMLEN